MGKLVIIGGTGQIGHAVARTMLAAGWDVTVLHRGGRAQAAPVPPGAHARLLDRDEPDALAKILAEGADAVFDCIAYDGAHAAQLLAAQGDLGAIIAVSSISVYADVAGRTLDEARDAASFPDLGGPATEEQATIAPGPATYSTRKVEMELTLLAQARIPVTVLRPGAIHGPYSPHPREWWFLKRMRDKRRCIPLKYRGASRFSTSSTANIAALTELVLAQPGTRVLNALDDVSLPVIEIGRHIAQATGWTGAFMTLDEWAEHDDVGASPWGALRPFTGDGGAARALGFRPQPYQHELSAYLDWIEGAAGQDWRAAFPGFAPYADQAFAYAAEDAWLAAGAPQV